MMACDGIDSSVRRMAQIPGRIIKELYTNQTRPIQPIIVTILISWLAWMGEPVDWLVGPVD